MFRWLRYSFAAVVLIVEFVAFIGWPFPVPSDLKSVTDFAVWVDLLLINNAAYPGIFLFGLIMAALLMFPELSQGIMWLRGKAEHPRLKVTGPCLHQHHLERHYRMVVENAGGGIALNVKILLRNITPRPRYSPWRADYPYPMNRVTTVPGLEHSPCQIGPDLSEVFEVIAGWPNETGLVFAGSLDTKVSYRNPVQIFDDERWTLAYEVTADNAKSIKFALDAYVKDETLIVELSNQWTDPDIWGAGQSSD